MFLYAFSAKASFTGLNYRHIETEDPLSIHLLEIDPNQYFLQPVKAYNDGIGRETVRSMAKRKGALAAINGGFFGIGEPSDGLAKGVLKIGASWFALANPKGRGALGWSVDSKTPLFSRILTKPVFKVSGQEIKIDGINRPRGKNETILYTYAYHRSTLTAQQGVEYLIKGDKIVAILKNQGDSLLPFEGMVLSTDIKEGIKDTAIKEGALVSFKIEVLPLEDKNRLHQQLWQNCDYIIGGGPLLIFDGKPLKKWDKEQLKPSFITEKTARTAIGFNQKGFWIFVVVDGPKLPLSRGVSLDELTEIMLKENCIFALNLDGGGSSTLFFREKIVNYPMGDQDDPLQNDQERAVSDAILVLPR